MIRFEDIKEYIKLAGKKMENFDKVARNPFTKDKYKYNPFKNAFSQTYVWIEKEKEDEKAH